MKSVILVLCFIFSAQLFAKNSLTRFEEAKALEAFDSICGDTWCGGDFNFSFNELDCNYETKSCVLSFEYIYEVYDYNLDEITQEQRVDVTCTILEVINFDSIISSSSRTGALTNKFYDEATDCFSEKLYIAYDTFEMD